GSARNGGGEGVPGSRDDEAARLLRGEGTVPDGGQRQVGEGPHRARLRAGTGGSSYRRHKIARCCLPLGAQPQDADAGAPARPFSLSIRTLNPSEPPKAFGAQLSISYRLRIDRSRCQPNKFEESRFKARRPDNPRQGR